MSRRAVKKNEGVSRDLKRYGLPLDYPYLMGTYMAVNAVPGTVILIDGPDCATGKAEHIFGKHDWGSTLLECTGLNRVECSFTDARNTALSREKAVRANLSALAKRPDVAAILLSALPMSFVAGTDYKRILKRAAQDCAKPMCYIPPRSLQGGYLDGYDEALKSLAECIPLQPGRSDKNKVAIVGYFMDRFEEDHRANLRELRRLLTAVGLEVVSAWFDGTPYPDLGKIARAGTILSLPYGRRAARILAKRTGARVLELELPVGIDGTRRWLERAAHHSGRKARAQRFIDEELKRIIPRMEWVVPHMFLNKRFWLSGDPCLLGPLAGFIEELGGRIVGRAVVGMAKKERAVLVRPTSGDLEQELERVRGEGVDLIVGNSDVLQRVPHSVPSFEFGFPSYFRHALYDSPFLGFSGALSLMDRLANEMSRRASPRLLR